MSTRRLGPFLIACALLAAVLGGARPAAGDYPPPEYVRAVTLANSGHRGEARAVFLGQLRQTPDDPRLVERVVAEFARVHAQKAGIDTLLRLSKENPEATALLGGVAALYQDTKRFDEARSLLLRLVRNGSRHPEHFYSLIGLYHLEKLPEASQALLDSLDAAHPGDPLVSYARGIAAWFEHDLNEATDWLEQAVAGDPDLFDARMTLGNIQHHNLAPTAAYETWGAGLRRAGEIGDRVAQFDFLGRLGEAYWNAGDERGVAVLEEAIILGEQLGEYTTLETMRTHLFQIELDLGRLDRVAWWGLEEVARTLESGDSSMAAKRLAFLAGSLEPAGERWTAAGFYERALRTCPLERYANITSATASRLARLLLRLGDCEGARVWAGRAMAAQMDLPAGPSQQFDFLENELTLAHAALFTGQQARADSLYRLVIDRPAPAVASVLKAEAGLGLARLTREAGDLGAAREALGRARISVAASGDSTLAGVAEDEELSLLLAEGKKDTLALRARAIVARPGGALPMGLQSRAALHLARLALPDRPEEGLDFLLKAWILAEREHERGRPSNLPLPEGLLPDPEEPLERLALFFAQLAMRPGETPGWSFRPAEGTSHEPRTPQGILAARWSFFFTERRAARGLVYNLSAGFGAPLPRYAPALELPLWEKVSQRARAHGLSLVKGNLPKGAPAFDQPLFEDLAAPARTTALHAVPDLARVPWLVTPVETSALGKTLQATRETVVRAAVLEPMTLLYIIQQDRIRLVPVPLTRDELAAKVHAWAPYRALACTTPTLETLSTDFNLAGQLFSSLLAPVGESADLSRTVWISADGPLWSLPFESLAPRGGTISRPDSGSVLQQTARVPIALDQYRIAYLLDPGALVAGGSGNTTTGKGTRVILPAFGTDGAYDPEPELLPCLADEGADAASWRVPPCEPRTEDMNRLLLEASTTPAQARPDELELARTDPARTTVFFCPVFDRASQPWEGGILLGSRRTRDQDGFLRWSELARLPGSGTLLLPEATACRVRFTRTALYPSRWGSDVTFPALAAAFAGYRSVIQTMWNAGEATWIPLAGCLHDPEGPKLDTFLAERQRLRSATIPAGPEHALALGHPFFSCATRWWQLAPATSR